MPGQSVFGTTCGRLQQPARPLVVKAGVRERWHPLGHTVLYGFYAQRNDMFDEVTSWRRHYVAAQVRNSEGLGVVQEIDAAAMSMWLQ